MVGLASVVTAIVLITCAAIHTAAAQQPTTPAPPAGLIEMNLPEEVDLRVLAGFVSQRLKINILYDDAQIGGKKIGIRAPGKIPVESLLPLLQSALKMRGLALVDDDVPGWKRIVLGDKLPAIAPTGDAEVTLLKQGGSAAITQPFVLKYADPQKTDAIVKPFLTTVGANSIFMKSPDIVIVTDYAANVKRIADLIALFDQPRPTVAVEFVRIQNGDAQTVAQYVNSVLQAKQKTQGDPSRPPAHEVVADVRTNQVVVVGEAAKVKDILEMIEGFDVSLNISTEAYSLQYMTAERLDRDVHELLGAAETKLYRAVVEKDANLLIVVASPDIHAQVRELRRLLDTPTPPGRYSLQIYRLKNTTSDEVLNTLRAIAGVEQETVQKKTAPTPVAPPVVGQSQGAMALPLAPGQPPPANYPTQQQSRNGSESRSREGGSSMELPGGARVTADANTNSLIVMVDPTMQKMYEDMIQSLDRRRPQVLIEAKIVSIDTSNNFSLGVELGGGNAGRMVTFSSFGLSTPNPVTGALALIPGAGFNGALIDPTTAEVIVRAFAKETRAKIVAAPRVLVDDNVAGQLQSVLSIPFASVNASQTVATTSVGGNQDAGVTIFVTPHISDGDHLQLEFQLQLSSFSGASANNLPPPRQISQMQSTVTIPDGYTIIAGGLNRDDHSSDVQGIPGLLNIPIINLLTSIRTKGNHCTTLFVFLRPTILRDDKFKDLKYLSDRDAQGAGIPATFPRSEPILMR